MIDKLIWVGVVLLLSFTLYSGYNTWILGGQSSDYDTVCIQVQNKKYGHQYHRANWAAKMAIGIQLTDDGKPIQCTIKE